MAQYESVSTRAQFVIARSVATRRSRCAGDDYTDEIFDPDTGAILGSVEQAKTQVKVERACDKFSVAATCRSKEVNIAGKGLLGFGFSPPKWEIHCETLKEKGSFQASFENLDEESSFVDIGGPVVQVTGSR